MRRIVGPVLLFFGAFLIVIGLLARFYMGDALMKTPINVDEVIHLDGSAQTPNTKGKVVTVPVIATSTYHTNTSLSDSSVASFQNAQCLLKDVGNPVGCPAADAPQGLLLSATTDNFATDRLTAEAVNDPAHLPAGSVEHTGLINKWPFEGETKSYTYWDDATQQGVTAKYVGIATINGHEAHVYQVQVPKTAMEVAAGLRGFYFDSKKIFVDPLTGSVLDQREHQIRTDTKGGAIIDLTLGFTDAQVHKLVDDAKTNGNKLNLIRNTLPIVGLAVGIPVLLIGLWLTLGSRRKRQTTGSRRKRQTTEPTATD